ncbi:MAG TPA: hypothetical protein VJ798_02025 [Rhizomicrobium sp.]|nr:hypothetical protein [Rhizomicrobium sp.]
MKSIPLTALPLSSLTFVHNGGSEAAFVFPALGEDAPRMVTVRTDGTMLRFFPERSAGHRDVLQALGL